jgi:hypothetical protein
MQANSVNVPAMLDIKGVSITSNLFHHLVREYIRATYLDYIQSKEEWDDDTVASIAWKSFLLAITRINKEVVITKLCKGILLTMKVQHKRKQSSTKKCPLCNTRPESQEHMLQCNDKTRKTWRQALH